MTSELDRRKSFERDCYNKMVENSLVDKNNIQWKYGADSIAHALKAPYKYIEDELLTDINGKIILDYCCGDGIYSIFPALKGAFIYGIDISDKSIEVAKARAEYFGVPDKTEFKVMDAENLKFEDNTFDIVMSYGSLSYLELKKAYSEFVRVLKTDGKIIILDTLGHNPILNMNRRKYIKTGKRQKYHLDNIMTIQKINFAKKYFNEIDVKFFDLFVLFGLPFKNSVIQKPLLPLLKGIDSIVLQIPPLNRLAFKFVMVLKKPILV